MEFSRSLMHGQVYNGFKLQAYALILLRGEGHPSVLCLFSAVHYRADNHPRRCVFYGDLYPNRECDTSPIAPTLLKLIELRKKHAYGPVKDYFYDKNCIGFVRMGEQDREGCVVVISNADRDRRAQYVLFLLSAGQTSGKR